MGNTQGVCTIFTAAKSGNIKDIQRYLDQGINVNMVDERGCTPLIYACFHCHVEVVKLLIHHGANVNYKSTTGAFALAQAAYHGHAIINGWS